MAFTYATAESQATRARELLDKLAYFERTLGAPAMDTDKDIGPIYRERELLKQMAHPEKWWKFGVSSKIPARNDELVRLDRYLAHFENPFPDTGGLGPGLMYLFCEKFKLFNDDANYRGLKWTAFKRHLLLYAEPTDRAKLEALTPQNSYKTPKGMPMLNGYTTDRYTAAVGTETVTTERLVPVTAQPPAQPIQPAGPPQIPMPPPPPSPAPIPMPPQPPSPADERRKTCYMLTASQRSQINEANELTELIQNGGKRNPKRKPRKTKRTRLTSKPRNTKRTRLTSKRDH